MGTEFFQTKMGHKFYGSDIPKIADSLKEISESLKEITLLLKEQQESQNYIHPIYKGD